MMPDEETDDDADDADVAELQDAAELARRIAEYLRLNGFANLADAAAKGWGDTRSLRKETLQ